MHTAYIDRSFAQSGRAKAKPPSSGPVRNHAPLNKYRIRILIFVICLIVNPRLAKEVGHGLMGWHSRSYNGS